MTRLRKLLAAWLALCLSCCLSCCLTLAVPRVAHAALPVRAALLLNCTTGQILYEQGADIAIPPASLTKVMTMFLALDAVRAKRIKENRVITVPAHAARVGGSTMHLKAGERATLSQLLTGMAVASGNDAATTVAHVINPKSANFVRAMNSKARELGMRATVFKNPTGLPAPGQITTARDMMRLASAYLKRHPQAQRRYHATRSFSYRNSVFANTNQLLGVVQGVDGLKTGFTVASGYNIIVTATMGKTRLMAVVLGGKTSAKRNDAARRLIEAGFKYPTSRKKLKRNL